MGIKNINSNKRIVEFSKPLCSDQSILEVFETCLMLVESGLKGGNEVELRFKNVRVLYPTLSIAGNVRFVRFVRVMGIVQSQMKMRETVSKRGVYYMDVSLFEKQRVVDGIIDIILTCLPRVKLSDLYLRAVEKGLYSIGGEASRLIGEETKFCDEGVRKLVVIEKESVFTNIIKDSMVQPDCVYVTGRGFPDRLTIQFVNKIKALITDVECVVDCDVYGVLIANQYGIEPSKGWLLFDVQGGFLPVTKRDISMLFGGIRRLSKCKTSLRELQRQLFYLLKREIDISK